MSNIAVVGMGQGGMTAAIKLAQAGHNVTVFEKNLKGEVSYPWTDDIRLDIFERCGFENPPSDSFVQKPKWLFVAPDGEHGLPFPPLAPMEEVSISRRALSAWFGQLAENSGCCVRYGVEVLGVLLDGDRVVGVKTADGEQTFDLVIDASGLNSVLRAQIPPKFGIQPKKSDEGTLSAYRAFYEPIPGARTVEDGIDCTLYLKHLGEKGISWCNLASGRVDVLIGRVATLSDKQIDDALDDLKKHNAIFGGRLIYARRVDICLTKTIARGVADGYVAIGDSAFMTMPLMGSGIESSMKAGKMFADFVIANKTCPNDELFSAQKMWEFWRQYNIEMGADFAFIDALKNWLLNINPKWIDWVFSSGIIQKEDLLLIGTETEGVKIPARSILKKVGMILLKPALLFSALKAVIKALNAKSRCKHISKKFKPVKVK